MIKNHIFIITQGGGELLATQTYENNTHIITEEEFLRTPFSFMGEWKFDESCSRQSEEALNTPIEENLTPPSTSI